ncbi:MAG: hypothetical protein K1X35_00150 [Caulobacteraceae bacterium]|nr:hypothetical protein [Caulobacteraceae bacterium]
MTAALPVASRARWTPLKAVLVGGLAASLGDFLAAMAIWRVSWEVIGHAIAAGWLGREAARVSGTAGALLGAASHTAILLIAAALFVVASRRYPALVRAPWLTGPLYGLAIFLIMTFVVVPLSAAARPDGPAGRLAPTLANALDLGSHLFLVGLPIALAAWKARRR